jgi:hypothetical protein
MADDTKSGAPQEEKIFSRMKLGPGQAPSGLRSFVGLLSRSSKEGYWLLYPSLDMSRVVEIKEEDIVHTEQLSDLSDPMWTIHVPNL